MEFSSIQSPLALPKGEQSFKNFFRIHRMVEESLAVGQLEGTPCQHADTVEAPTRVNSSFMEMDLVHKYVRNAG
jgi:hypothetical protein